MLLSSAIGTALARRMIRFQVGNGMIMIVAVIVAAIVINIRKPLHARATSSGAMPWGVAILITFPSCMAHSPES